MNNQQQKKSLIVLITMTLLLIVMELIFMIPAINNFFLGWFNSENQWSLWLCLWLIMFLQTNILQIPAVMILQASLKAQFNIVSWQYILVVMSAYMVGIILSYFLGAKFGSKAVKWIAGDKEEFDKWTAYANKKGKTWYFITVLLPIFPDDLLCLVAGSLKIDFKYYVVANVVGRTIGLITMVWFLTLADTISTSNFPTMLILWIVALIAEIIYYIILTQKIKKENNGNNEIHKNNDSPINKKNKNAKKIREKKDEKMKITSKELRNTWLNFYKEKGHVDIGAVSLIGDGTTGVMFNVAGMQPLMPYLLGKKHPQGTRLCNLQGCVRTVDIDSVGDASHCTFFEMMGNWSLGDYFKKEKTAWTFELLTTKFGLDKNKICSTVFAGNESAPRDEETANYLKQLGIKPENIFYQGKEDNWWELDGTVGTPCGPDNEWFYPLWEEKCCDKCDINCKCHRYVEIGNDVYMQYEKLKDGYKPLQNKNVDTGFGFERMLMFLNGLTDVYATDLYIDVISHLVKATNVEYGKDENITKSIRIIADHIRTSVMLIGDKNGITPSNIGAGYILRRLLRRAIRHAKKLELDTQELIEVAKIFIEKVYNEAYPLLIEKEQYILSEIQKEIDKFNKALEQGLKEFDKVISGIEKHKEFALKTGENVKNEISGKSAFRLYDTFGFPLELTIELAIEKSYTVDEENFKICFEEHQAKSKAVEKGEFKSGLQDTNEQTIKYHTATHLLNSALKLVFGKDCHQMGSNITAERLRFDFPCDHKLEDNELKQIETIVNGWIKQELPVTKEEMSKQKAVEIGAEHQFIDKYPDIVSVYSIGDVSKEICTGPHVNNTKELGIFEIVKEESSSAGVRRIKAVLK